MDVDWTGTKPEDWKGRTIVSQYGLVCEVLDACQEGNEIKIKCRSLFNERIWNWTTYKISLVTKGGEILDFNGEIFGKVNGHDFELYSDEECRKITQEEVEKEFQG